MRSEADDATSNELAALSPRQAECLRLVYERKTSKEIAQDLGVRASTVDSYIAEAVALLGARNRRHAAEMAHAGSSPDNLGGQSSGVDQASMLVQPTGRQPFRFGDLLPLRKPGAAGNDIEPVTRVFLVLALSIGIAIGFGMLAVGARVVSDVFAAWFAR